VDGVERGKLYYLSSIPIRLTILPEDPQIHPSQEKSTSSSIILSSKPKSTMPSWTIAIGCDDAGSEYKELLKADLEKDPRVKAVIDCGVTKGSEDFKTAYPHTAVATARKVVDGEADRALLICGTGMGVAMSANKVKGIRVRQALWEGKRRWLINRHQRRMILFRWNDL
jgi:RpiB/LacA/LacB family sugar-phosphate isomerase